MEFVTIRDLRLKPAEVWDKLRRQRELVLTSNGRPVAVMAGVREDDVAETGAALRRAPGRCRTRRGEAAGSRDRVGDRPGSPGAQSRAG
jgi:prevent-host-death family protein